MTKKLVAMILGVTMLIPAEMASAETKNVPSGYSPIYTVEDLYGINDNMDGKYILMNDINLSETRPGGDWDAGNGWTPIGVNGSDIEYFNGILDGNGYRIEHMTIYGDKTARVLGLFGALNGTVRNLAVTDISITSDYAEECGGIAGWQSGQIDACYVSGTIQIENGRIIGGIGGDMRGDDASVVNCYTDVDITNNDTSSCIGGVIGGMYSGNISTCYAIGNIDSASEECAAITVSDAYKGYSGYSNKCYYAGGQKDPHAKKLSKAQMKSQKCFTGFDFKKVWVVDKYSSYPYPQLRSCMQVRTESIELISEPNKLEYTTADKIDLTGSELKINYEDDYSVTVPLDESMISYKMEEGNQKVKIQYNDCKTSFAIHVKKAKETLKITAKKTKLKIGESFTYKVKYVGNGKVTYTSSNENVVAIQKYTGKARAKKAGTVTITVKAGKLKRTVKVTVKK